MVIYQNSLVLILFIKEEQARLRSLLDFIVLRNTYNLMKRNGT